MILFGLDIISLKIEKCCNNIEKTGIIDIIS